MTENNRNPLGPLIEKAEELTQIPLHLAAQ